MEFYIPSRYVSQAALEAADGVSPGKYTLGLGQDKMAFVDDREDANSIQLSALQRLLDAYDLDPASIGRLEVGTESLVDKSKSTKTTLMALLGANASVEGATVLNACYGGTAAVLNSAAWIESSEWDGRFAVAVAGDIAVYEAGPARPTGGCGAVAMLIGPRAPLALVPRARATHAADVYDFYKPTMGSEYPAVDGKLSQSSYLAAVDSCYSGTLARLGAARMRDAFDHVAFHSPYNKLVQQSYRRMLFNDAVRAAARGAPLPSPLEPLAPFLTLPHAATIGNRDLDKVLAALPVGADYADMVGPTEALSKSIGNSYTAALWANLACLVSAKGPALAGKRVGAFSYGSGAIATMMAFKGTSGDGRFSLERMAAALDVPGRLAARTEAPPAELLAALKMREEAYGRFGRAPTGSLDYVPSGAWYLKEVAADGSRKYARKG
jgi:hydroxymethylglutaryl-CoA synthase